MRTLYIDCSMGAAGDMLTSALLELVDDADTFVEKLNNIGIPDVKIEKNKSVKCGITGTHVSVKVHGEEEDEHFHEHHHSSLHNIEHIVEHLKVSGKVKKDVMAVYNLIAEAESHAHGVPVTEIHFHEVGTMDAVADVTSVCMLMEAIGAQKIIVSPIHVGSGQVKCAHGILPVPAPATAYILRECPIYSGEIKGELCTPTGAALLKYFADDFGSMPEMKVAKIGYGMGNKDFPAANCVRIMLGESTADDGTITELQCNVDDMTAEEIGFAMERFYDGGALEVYTVSVGMKKNRPGQLICVLCNNSDKERMANLIFKYTTTLGIRETLYKRYKLKRTVNKIETPYGTVREKVSSGYGVERSKFEYDDLSRIAVENGIALEDVRKIAKESK